MTMTTFEIYKDRKKEWRWRAKRKGRIVADSGEGYNQRANCRKSLMALIRSIGCGNYDIESR